MKVLVTGATGKVGSVTARYLAEQGFQVTATDLVMRPGLGLRPVFADLLDPQACYNLVQGMDALVHLANHPYAQAAPFADLYVENLSMNLNVFQAAVDCGVKKILFASTVQTTSGDRPPTDTPGPSGLAYLPADGDLPQRPGNIYALSKCVSEDLLRYYSQLGSMQCVAIRLPWVIDEHALPPRRSRKTTPRQYLNLDECFSYILAGDVARLVQKILENDLPGFRSYFPAAADPICKEPASVLIARYFSTVPLKKPREQILQLVDNSRITAETGWTPGTPGTPGTPQILGGTDQEPAEREFDGLILPDQP